VDWSHVETAVDRNKFFESHFVGAIRKGVVVGVEIGAA